MDFVLTQKGKLMRMIDADALFREMEKVGWYDNADRDEVAEELVMNAHTIEPERIPVNLEVTKIGKHVSKFDFDAEPEIVLCKDCVKRNRKLGSLDEHYNRYNKSQCCPMIEFRGMPQGHEFDYQYCSWAERRTDE